MICPAGQPAGAESRRRETVRRILHILYEVCASQSRAVLYQILLENCTSHPIRIRAVVGVKRSIVVPGGRVGVLLI